MTAEILNRIGNVIETVTCDSPSKSFLLKIIDTVGGSMNDESHSKVDHTLKYLERLSSQLESGRASRHKMSQFFVAVKLTLELNKAVGAETEKIIMPKIKETLAKIQELSKQPWPEHVGDD